MSAYEKVDWLLNKGDGVLNYTKEMMDDYFLTKSEKGIMVNKLLKKSLLNYNGLNIDGMLLVESFPRDFMFSKNPFIDKVLTKFVKDFKYDYINAISYLDSLEIRQNFLNLWIRPKSVNFIRNMIYEILENEKNSKKTKKVQELEFKFKY
ncbi:hypothetical protein SCORR_v1c02030 [Spiroplasma corruscae]|uniref:Uncharacterized protein n=1 Tax=Spiroplasma corruscae TaxID=216934 RepID=A0A222EN98_9MOLU|nr:hypothetical protein [Spiroplasma corruscae]ASP27978.1 hypothetical protein SCORR_v1c02030 [Spiroplasma corruscae]